MPPRSAPTIVDPRRRMRLGLVTFLVLLAVVFGRVVQLEVTQGPAFRAQAAKPLTREESLPGVRGRILARNGDVLACDEEFHALAVHYRWLEEPANPQWLRSTARSRLPRRDRNDPNRLAAEEALLRAERVDVAQRLAQLAGVSTDEWQHRSRRVQARVERIAESVNRRRQAESIGRSSAAPAPSSSLLQRIRSRVAESLRASIEAPREPITVAEELDYHVVVDDAPPSLVAGIEAQPDRYACAKMVLQSRRVYPAGRLAAHVLGYLGDVRQDELTRHDPQSAYQADDRVGRAGIELQYEHLLRGRPGIAIRRTDRSGHVLWKHRQREPQLGRDLVLTLDPRLQRAAEDLLHGALERRAILDSHAEPAGGAIVVIDTSDGAVLAAASAPDFDPNHFARGTSDELAALFSDPARPLFNRAVQMAIPPGSVFKPVAAVALVEAGAVKADEPFFCRGYLHQPERWRCAIYTRHAVGHGQITLADALSESCNVYFFHHAGRLGPEPLGDWASRFGFGRATAVDLPQEASGTLPTAATIADTQALLIGQGSLEATPLQIVRMMAAIANDGRLVTPHLVSRLGAAELEEAATRIPPPQPIAGLQSSTLATIRQGLRRVVADVRGTAHGTVHLDAVPIAAKTGTAETGPGHADHAWLAGYVPADEPTLAFVIALEHAGDAAQAAGPVAKRLVLQMDQLGYFDESYREGDLAASTSRNCGMK
ncbi:MAG: hypothetical protein HQ582_21080 [Planctomycetes bacterium]|nr:hypothetical protein [Planctomycetota bacterium]